MEPHYNFADLFEIAADKVPDRVAIIDHKRRVTYRELDERTNRLAHAMQDGGVQAGDHVGIDATNCIEWPEAALALYKLRAVPVNVNFRYVEEELRYLFENSDIVGIVYMREYGPVIAKARDAQPMLTRFWRIEDESGADDSALNAVEFEDAIASGSPERDWPERSNDDIYLLYTGGTTGMPKGVMWRQEDVYYALAGGIDTFTNEKVTSPYAASERINPDFALVSHPSPPLMHGAGQFATFRMLFEGGTLVYRPSFDAEDVLRSIEREKINVLMVTGDAMARPLADALERLQGQIDLSSLLSFGSTAAIFSQTVKEQLRALLGPNLVMTDAIGSTETGMNGIRVVQDGDAPKEGITTVLASADTTVLDDDLQPVAPGSGTVGRLARGGNIPLGYYKDPEKSAATFITDSEGRRWSIPGDFATVEADGRITLMGRGSVSINSGGEKVFPEEVEGALKAHPDVFDVLVVGVPDDRWGERVTAVIQPREGRTPALEDLVAHCRGKVASYKIPRQVFLVEIVPRLPNGKPDYPKAKATALQLVASDG
ncbi:MAG TPA: acyl-CoA synthetase [Acidimicrobiia bacterium]|jgi:acyl-CoA synthetase (AMP-forming)/AMP-acid ligase II|nr:acyl-CoA synthetase [Acidimicrobiia bacterium]